MAKNYKSVEYSSTAFETKTYYKNQKFTNADEGISSIQFRSESLVFDDDSGPISYTTSGSHYNFLSNFLTDKVFFTDGYSDVFTNKFHPSGSVIYIPQQYYGEQIKVKSFKLTDNSTSKEIIIQDDGNGNLYSTNAHASRSNASSLSSSDNYVGNIHYQTGVVMITETGSWSGSGTTTTDIMYTDVGTGNYSLEFNSTMPIFQNEIVCNISKNEFTATGNQTIWSTPGTLQNNISSSLNKWTPYATSIAFYDRPPDVFGNGAGKTIKKTYPISPGGNNTIIWDNDDVENLNNIDIPAEITRILYERPDGMYDEARRLASENPPYSQIIGGTWFSANGAYVLDILKNGREIILGNMADYEVQWNITSDANNGVPLIVANFPRAVKIDKESDLTIIIRYDT